MLKNKSYFWWVLILLLMMTPLVLSKWGAVESVSAYEGEAYKRIKTFVEVLSLVKQNYVEEVDDKELVYGAIRGMLSSLDPHSSFMTPDSYHEMQIETKGEFGGLGIQIGMKDNMLTVIAPIEDTPAFVAGVKAGDMIIKINNETTKDLTLMEAVNKLRGDKGTSVTITIVRAGLEKPIDFTIIRDIIKTKSVKHKIIDNEIGYVRLMQFQEQSAADLETALVEISKTKGITGLVLDLRNNPGGLLNSAVDVSSKFLPANKLVVYIKGRVGEKTEYKTKNGNKPYDYPMIILVNEGSASASEIVAGALQDWGRAVILGTKTFGKGSVQTVMELSDGSGLRLTTARYYTPKDRSIQTTGIEPDITVKSENGTGNHPVVREKDLARHLENDSTKKSADKEDKKDEAVDNTAVNEEDAAEAVAKDEKAEDIQLQRAVDLLKGWQVFKELKKAS
ncbi:MAG: S41 family peptidase [Nitrospirae bacterium]|nr:S41 family peptidase [Nitrospirota bacterium]